MPFNAEYTNTITVWAPPNASQDSDGEEFVLSVAVELPIYLTLPAGIDAFDHEVAIDGREIKITVYQDGLKFFYGDHFTADRTLRYKLLRSAEAAEEVERQAPTGRKYIEKMRTIARLTEVVRIRDRERFVLHQLRPYCETLMEACNRIMEAERATFHLMAWNYPYRLSFLSAGLFWVSLYKGSIRECAFPFMGNAGRIGLNPPTPASPDSDWPKVVAAVTGRDAFPDWWMYYCKAATHLGQQNHREAVLEAIIALEMGLSRYVRAKWKERGISNNAIDRVKRDVTLSTMINVEMTILADADSRPTAELIGDLNSARKLRNEIVHDGRTDVSEKDAAICLTAVRTALLLMSSYLYKGQLLARVPL